MILLQTGPTFADDPAVLRIYRRRDHPGDPIRGVPDHGAFVRDIALADLWPVERTKAMTSWWSGAPEWFEGGKFEFSPDSRLLIVTTRWRNVIQINLETGSLTAR